jgi:hypothetical protein
MVISKCYKCYILTSDFVLRSDKYGTYQSICLECDYKKKNCWYGPFLCLKKIFCCGKDTSEAVTEAKTSINELHGL